MQLHSVKKDETLYAIARKHSIPATKILADNDLAGDRLTSGDELVIIKPTKTITVKGGDTLDSISKRFDVRKSSIIRDNPSLFGKEKLRPGQILTVKQDEVKIGAGSILGYAEKGLRREKFSKSLPYITYLTISMGIIKGDSVTESFLPNDLRLNAVESGKIVLLGIRDESSGEFLSSKESYRKIIDATVRLAEERGFMGISISAREASGLYPDAYCEFLFELRKRLFGCNMILFTELFENTLPEASEICDGAALNLELTPLDDAIKAMKSFSEKAESSKVFVKAVTRFTSRDLSLSVDDIKELCYRSGKELITDEKSLISRFDYVRYKIGKGEEIPIFFPSLRYIKAKLEALCELGFMGIGCDIDTVPLSNLTMFNSMFARADYSLA
ncbi:MAG: LysM peptidoglycan-binding domain-containing protein [Ruminococcaceae bacterium]|nr:LysM peptidoglycan-binding domain-containing protein [Oscillospiraceae bacterium]